MVFLDPTTDIAFKKLFANQAKKGLVIDFLNNVLALQPGDQITDVVITDPSNHPETASSKSSIVDVRCVDQKKRSYIVEMQVSFQSDFRERSQYYAAHAIARQLGKGEAFNHIMPVVFIAILDFKLFENNHQYISHHKILDVKTHHQELQHLSFCFIELPKFNKTLEQLNSVEDRWIYIFKNASELKTVPTQLKTTAALEEAMSTLEEGAFSRAELAAYEKLINSRRTEESILRSAQEIGLREGLQKGLLEGREKGLLEGRQEGRQEGALETSKTIARALLAKNMSPAEITQITGLTLSEVEALSKK